MKVGPQTPEISLLTFVLQAHHCVILNDWLDFFDRPVKRLVVHIANDPAIREALKASAEKRAIEVVIVATTTAEETTNNELNLLFEQLRYVDEMGLACLVKLDTFPFRAPGKTWQEEALVAMQKTGALFITGSTLPYRADQPTTSNTILTTGRVSNCFLIVSKSVWLRALEGALNGQSQYGRFSSEGDFENYLASTDQFGLRIVNTPDLRIFHCHEWGFRQGRIRDLFRQGKGVAKFLSGYQDDYWGPNAKYYMAEPRPLVKRIRIVLGRWRRQFSRSE